MLAVQTIIGNSEVMAKDQRKKQKKKQQKESKRKAKRNLLKKANQQKNQLTSEIILDKVDFALELAQEGDFEQALEILLKLKKKHSQNSDVQFGLGVMALYAKDTEVAIKHFDKAIILDPLYIHAHFNRATAYQEQANVKCLVESLINVINLAHVDSELAAQAKEKLDGISASFNKNSGISLDQFIEAQTNFETGFEFMEKHEFHDAIPYYKKAISINPDPPQPYGNLGICYACLGEKETALSYIDIALEINPNYQLAASNRLLIEKLGKGEKLSSPEIKSVNYYVDY